jgi:hypothetical protein
MSGLTSSLGIFAAAVLLPVGMAPAQEKETAPWAKGVVDKPARPAKGTPLLLIEPRSMRPDVSVMVPGARDTVFSAAYQGALGARHYSRDGFGKAYPDGWKVFFEGAKTAAAEHLKSLKPKMVRGRNKVIEYALLQSDHVLTPTVILAPEFASMFAETLGDQLLIAIPDRSTVIVFPKLAGGLQKNREGLSDLFEDAVFPVSGEVFELTKDGIRAVGDFRAD